MENQLITVEENHLSNMINEIHRPSADDFILNFQLYLPLYIAKGRATSDTLKDYTWKINAYLRWCIEHRLNPLEMTNYEVVHYRKYLTDQGYANSTINQYLNAVKAFYRMAMKLGLITVMPIEDVDVYVPRTADSEYYYYDLEQIQQIISVAGDTKDEYQKYRNVLIIMLLGFQGLRNIELHRLNDNDLNLEAKTLTIHSKGHSGRVDVISMADIVANVAKRYLELRPDDCQPDAMGIPLFRSFNQKKFYGKRMSRMGYQRIVNAILEKAHLKKMGACCHVLRHSCGTNLYQKEKDLRLVQNFLRHSDPSVTARYTHIKDDSTYDAINSITKGIKI